MPVELLQVVSLSFQSVWRCPPQTQRPRYLNSIISTWLVSCVYVQIPFCDSSLVCFRWCDFFSSEREGFTCTPEDSSHPLELASFNLKVSFVLLLPDVLALRAADVDADDDDWLRECCFFAAASLLCCWLASLDDFVNIVCVNQREENEKK